MATVLHHYDENHFPTSASEVVPIVCELVKPNSVVDVGCGLAQWLYVFKSYGVKDILGIDGAHVPRGELYVNKENFLEYNLEAGQSFKLNKKFELVVSLEVAEHISVNSADGFVKMLTSLGDCILFSAAIPNQTGENHVNEQPHSYWKKKFEDQGFHMLDILRPLIWNNEKVNWWYRQNIFIVVKESHPLYADDKRYDGRQIIHPALLEMYVNWLRAANKPNTSVAITKRILKKISSLFK